MFWFLPTFAQGDFQGVNLPNPDEGQRIFSYHALGMQ
jgi:hypothetical protein